MHSETSRRGFIGGVAAVTAAGLLWTDRLSAADNPGDFAYRRADELMKMLAERQVSSRELVQAAIARIESLDAKVNAVVVRDFERAQSAADDADAALARGERRPLLGLPMTVKEQFNVVGLPTTRGWPKFKGWRPETDALAVQRLKAAGAIVIGKTNVPVNLTDWQSFNEVYGTTNNPWDLSRTPGGARGPGFVPLELGSDIGGSLRAPAHFCGVFSHKPSLELIPERGSGPPQTPSGPVRGDLSVIGPMARSAADLALALSVLAGPDELREGIGYRLALPPPRHERLADYRVLVLDRHPLCPTASDITTALDGLAGRLDKLGIIVLRQSPKLPDLALTTSTYAQLLMAVFTADLPANLTERLHTAAEALSPGDKSLEAYRLRGWTISHPDWIRANRIRGGLRARWQALFQEVDVLLCPPMPTAAFPHDHAPRQKRQIDVDGTKIPYDDQIAWAGFATLNGLPATTIPIGRTEAGLPIGAQIIGGFLDDRTTLAFAALVEREFGGFTPPPGF